MGGGIRIFYFLKIFIMRMQKLETKLLYMYRNAKLPRQTSRGDSFTGNTPYPI